ncbi:hypothetical protein BBJ28_00019881 [Nothophytophthora sp. Chile5]|nr:hypothetical protein BBJ28_00019881 [Nothophytophthora sp. Chile5]
MGGDQSKTAGGVVRRQVEPLVPRSWAELVQLHLRFQQEAHRRKADPLFQYFLTFPVFQTIVAPLCPTKDKTQLMAIFAALDRKNAQKLAVMDFFSGLALLVDAKKAQKLECEAAAGGFWPSLLDNGGLETLNRCELAMVTSAAARGLALFAPGADAPSDTVMKPVIRLRCRLVGSLAEVVGLFGEESEILRQTVVDKALADPEILFFMSDLEAVRQLRNLVTAFGSQ